MFNQALIPLPSNDPFTYVNINNANQNIIIDGILFSSKINPHTIFINFEIVEGSKIDLGWKIHVSVLETPDNIAAAWDALKDTLINYKIATAKVLKSGVNHNELQQGKEITIYCQSNPVDWQQMLIDITNLFILRGIKPGYRPINDKLLTGSSYFSCRTDKDKNNKNVSSLQVNGHNPSGKPHFFEDLIIEPHLLVSNQPSRPTRKNENQILAFYRAIAHELEIINDKITNIDYCLISEQDDLRLDEKLELNFNDFGKSQLQDVRKMLDDLNKLFNQFNTRGFGITNIDENTFNRILNEQIEKLANAHRILERVEIRLIQLLQHTPSYPNIAAAKIKPGQLGLLRGHIQDQPIYFRNIPNTGIDISGRPGSCGFIALRTTREKVISDLKKNIHNDACRSLIGQQVLNDFQIDPESIKLSFPHKSLLRSLLETINQHDIVRNELIKAHNKTLGLHNPGIDEIIAGLQQTPGNEAAISHLLKIKAMRVEAENDLNKFLQSGQLIQDYLDRNIGTEWLGAYVALAWAKTANITLRIWGHKDQNINLPEVYLLPGMHNIAVASIYTPIDMLLTNNATHFVRIEATDLMYEYQLEQIKHAGEQSDEENLPSSAFDREEESKHAEGMGSPGAGSVVIHSSPEDSANSDIIKEIPSPSEGSVVVKSSPEESEHSGSDKSISSTGSIVVQAEVEEALEKKKTLKLDAPKDSDEQYKNIIPKRKDDEDDDDSAQQKQPQSTSTMAPLPAHNPAGKSSPMPPASRSFVQYHETHKALPTIALLLPSQEREIDKRHEISIMRSNLINETDLSYQHVYALNETELKNISEFVTKNPTSPLLSTIYKSMIEVMHQNAQLFGLLKSLTENLKKDFDSQIENSHSTTISLQDAISLLESVVRPSTPTNEGSFLNSPPSLTSSPGKAAKK